MRHVKSLIGVFVFIAMTCLSFAQEFPIAVGSDNTFGGGGSFDGTNYLIAILGDDLNQYDVTAQLISGTGGLSGARISLGRTGSSPMVAFDGTNYLVVWTDIFPSFGDGDTDGIGDIYGQFISTSGNLVGTSFTIITGANIKFGKGRGGVTFQDTTYLLTFLKGGNHTDYLYGQRISKSGNSIGSPIQISSAYARECAIAFDGTNYLLAWCKVDFPDVDKDIYGQYLSKSGALVGTNFLIDGGPYASDNPVSMIFDGTKYWVAFHEQAADSTGRWNLYARFVSTSGAIADRFTVCDSSKNPTFAAAAFDGTNYLITWMELSRRIHVVGRFFTTSGIPIDTAFTVFDTLGGKFPIGGVGGFTGGHYVLTATRLDSNFSNGDIYGKFLQPLTTGVNEERRDVTPDAFALSQNYPNPFNPSTNIQFSIVRRQLTIVKVFDVLGREVATLVNEVKQPGTYTVQFSGSGLASGVYFYRLQAGQYVECRKMIVMK
jgi:hypothetical protein